MLKVYGLKNCDTCRNAMRWLEKSQIESKFYDLRAIGIDRASLVEWIDAVGWENLLNRRSTTWRNLPAEISSRIDGNSVINLMVKKPPLIKRPVFQKDCKVIIGFKEKQKKELKLLSMWS
tara:strand:- start:341 stop:700 length:360 start_codon:yes stop_codon:yes gene_type:complete